jgi:hypothetical protein
MVAPDAARRDSQGAEESLKNLRDRIARLHEASAITIPGYTVTSHAPVIGPLLARMRRLFTSHLREPYIDPILERQEKFNRELTQMVEQLAARLEILDGAPLQAGSRDVEGLEQARRTLARQVRHGRAGTSCRGGKPVAGGDCCAAEPAGRGEKRFGALRRIRGHSLIYSTFSEPCFGVYSSIILFILEARESFVCRKSGRMPLASMLVRARLRRSLSIVMGTV